MNLTGMIDSHFHSSVMEAKGMDSDFVLREAFSDGLYRALDIGTSLEDLTGRIRLAETFPGVLSSAGIYPSAAGREHPEQLVAELEKTITIINCNPRSPTIAAIGETGLDNYWNYGTPDLQRELFERQLLLADKLSMPVVIHNREADTEILKAIKNFRPERGGIFHCFSGNYDTAAAGIDLGFKISFAGNLTYKKNHALRETAAKLPDDSLLVETDSPYLSPQPVRGKPNHPGYIYHIYHNLAELRGITIQDLIEQIKRNFAELFPSAA